MDGSTSGPQQHKELWYEDGSIVLASDVHLYRVHKSMLVKHSTVLSNMFDVPSEGANVDFLDGVPIVKMHGDTDEEVGILLKSLYNRNFRESLEGTEFTSITSLLVISTKYDFQEIRADVVRFLESIFPDTYEKYKISKLHTLPTTCSQFFSLLSAASRLDVPTILPALHYRCANFPINDIALSLHLLPTDCVKGLLRGRDWMTKMSYYLLMKTLQFDQQGCNNRPCSQQFREQLNASYTFQSNEGCPTSILDVPDRGVLEGVASAQSKMCKDCEAHYLLSVRTAKTGFWSKMPKIFYLKGCEDFTVV